MVSKRPYGYYFTSYEQLYVFQKIKIRIYYCNIEKSLFYQWNGFTIVFLNQKSDTNWKNTLLSFLPINVIFSLKCACISSTILTFCHIFQCVFTSKIPKKLIIPQNATIIQSTLLTFLTKNVILPQNAPAYGARFWLFCPIIHCVFTPKTPKKFIFPQIVSIIQGILLSFLQKKRFFLKMRLHIEHYFDFFAQ